MLLLFTAHLGPSPLLPRPSNLLILIIFHYHQHNHQSDVCIRKIIRHFLFQQIHVLHPNNNHFFTQTTFAAPAYLYSQSALIQLLMVQKAIFADSYVQF